MSFSKVSVRALLAGLLTSLALGLQAQNEPGLRVTFSTGDPAKPSAQDTTVRPNVWLYVPAGQPASPFLPAGKFTAEWHGFVSVDLRAEYQFDVELNGAVKIELGGKVVKEASTETSTGPVPPTEPVRLNKGANPLKVTFTSPPTGDAFLRLFWFNKETARGPVALTALSHAATPELKQASTRRHGRELLVELRCLHCHDDPARQHGLPELAMDAPSFEGIGSRRGHDWLAKWILDPKAQRPTAHMPKLFQGANAQADADAAAAYLVTLKGETPMAAKAVDAEQIETGQKLFEGLHCLSCHNPPGGTEKLPGKVSLAQVAAKFSPGALPEFLQKPEAHYAWSRMPNFKLNAEQAGQLAAFLLSKADAPADTKPASGPDIVNRGRELVQTTGCLNCHSLKLENKYSAKAFATLATEKWTQGCLADKPVEASKAPWYGLTAEERAALSAFAATDRASLTRHVPAEYAERHARLLNCTECHGKFEGFPAFELIGGKLKPEWSRAFIAGEVGYKPRPWIDARMPAFPKRAEGLAQGLAMLNGLPPVTPPELPLDQEMAKVGQKLVSPIGGFSCISCHGAGELGATQVFESAGINFAYSVERLQKSYYERWLRNPLQVDSVTKMPVYFDEEGRSPLADIYDGDGLKQRDAIWHYLRLGDKMPPPPLQ